MCKGPMQAVSAMLGLKLSASLDRWKGCELDVGMRIEATDCIKIPTLESAEDG